MLTEAGRSRLQDEYSGFERKGGNPWYLCTLATAETLYNAATVFDQAGKVEVTNATLDFFDQFNTGIETGVYSLSESSAVFKSLLGGIRRQAEGLVQLATSHTYSNGSMSEQIDKNQGVPVGARDLTWSYVAFLTAQRAARSHPVF